MTRDPILREVREARERHAALFAFDLKAIFADLKRTERRRRAKFIAPPAGGAPQSETAFQRTRIGTRR